MEVKDEAVANKADRNFKRGLFIVVGLVWLFSAGAAALYAWQFGSLGLSNSQGKWGELGDFLGGVINPMIGIATVGLLAWSMTIQRDELKASVAELKDSNKYASRIGFEQALFSWLQNYHSQIAVVEVGSAKGKKALMAIYRSNMSPTATFPAGDPVMTSDVHLAFRQNPASGWEKWAVGEHQFTRFQQGLKLAAQQYETAFAEYQTELDAPLRTLYRLFKWVDGTGLDPNEKWHYCALIRAQLSWIELVTLFYNGMSSYGSKFARFANRYALFDNLQSSDPLLFAAKVVITPPPGDSERPFGDDWPGVWPYTAEAFDSRLAKQALGVSPNA